MLFVIGNACIARAPGPGGEGYCYIPIAILDPRPDEDDPTEVPPTPEDDPTEVRFSFVVGALRTNRLLSRAVESRDPKRIPCPSCGEELPGLCLSAGISIERLSLLISLFSTCEVTSTSNIKPQNLKPQISNRKSLEPRGHRFCRSSLMTTVAACSRQRPRTLQPAAACSRQPATKQ